MNTQYNQLAFPPQGALDAGESAETIATRKFVRSFLRRWRLFAGICIALIASGTLTLLLAPRTYTAEVRLIAGNPNRDQSESFDQSGDAAQGQTSLPVLNALVMSTGLQSSQTYAELLQETPVAERTITQLHLPTTPQLLLQRIHVAPINDTAMLRVQATWSDATTAATIANTMAQAFVDRERQLVISQADAGITFIQSQLPQAEARVKQANAALSQFMAAHHIADAATQSTAAATALDALDQKIAQTEVDGRQSAAQLASVRSEVAQTPDMIDGAKTYAPNPVAEQLEQQLAQLQVQLADARKIFTEKYPLVVSLRQRIADLRARITNLPSNVVQSDTSQSNQVSIQLRQQEEQLSSLIASDTAALDALRRQRAAMLPAISEMPKTAAELQVLQGRSKLAQDAYYAMLQKYDELSVEKSTALSDLTITQPASTGEAVRSPNLKLGLLAVVLCSLGTAVLVVLLLETFDARIASEEEAEAIANLPVLASIESLDLAESPAHEAIRRRRVEAAHEELLDAIQFGSDIPPRTISIVSASQGEGKSTTAVNVALALAERHPSVLLIDADLRRPVVHRLLDLPETPGLGDLLEQGWSFEHTVRPTKHPRLYALTCGSPVRTPLVLLQSPRFREILAHAQQRFSVIVIDTCALNPVHDGLEAASVADATVMVVTSGHTRRGQLVRALRRLAAAQVENLAGVVFNRATARNDRLADYAPRSRPSNAPIAVVTPKGAGTIRLPSGTRLNRSA